MNQNFHTSVLVDEVIGFLVVEANKWYLDGTLGDGGHSLEILKRGGSVFGIDLDPQAIERTQKRFISEGISQDRYILRIGNFKDLDSLTKDSGINFSGMVFDLGVSTLQLEEAERGFSFTNDGPLDMRMSPELGVKAVDLVNGLYKGELFEIFKKYGEVQDWHARRVAEAIVNSRPLTSTSELADVINKAIGNKDRSRINPATTYFQAIRIVINDELNSISEGLPKALERLETNGHIAVISFHSLEDRIVKNLFKKWQSEDLGEIKTQKIITPREDELSKNNRSRSAKLRVFRKS